MPIRYCPPLLYKYCDPSPERIESLANGLIRYTPLGAFNDPFEGRPSITSMAPENELERLVDELIPKALASLYDQIPQEKKAAFSYEQFANTALEGMVEYKKEILREIQSNPRQLTDIIGKKFDEHLGACSFSEVPDSLLMWAHYGRWHTGFVLELNAHHPHFHERRTDHDEFRHLRRVLYRSSRPSGTLTDLNGTEVFLVKSEHWAYEREWRIIRDLEDAAQVRDTSGGPVHLFMYPIEAVTSIILGARVTPDAEERLRAFVSKIAQKADVRIKRVVPDESDFVLRIRDEKP